MANISYDDLFKKYCGSSSSSSSSSNSASNSYSSSSSSSNYNSIYDMYEQNEKSYTSAKDCVYDLQKHSELFDRNIVDGYGKIKKLLENEDWRVDMDVNGDGTVEDGVKLADAIALSFDSELDLYIQEKLEDVINSAGEQNLRSLFGSKDSFGVKQLALLGIRIDAVGDDKLWQNRTYSFSLVELPDDLRERIAAANGDEEAINSIYDEVYDAVYDKDAKILTDKNGKKGSMIFSDCLIPDGVANGAEINLSSILDTMGYECISKADFIGREGEYYDLVGKIEELVQSGQIDASGTISDMFGECTLDVSTAVRAVYTANGDAPGHWDLGRSFEDTLKLIEKLGLGSDGQSSIRVNGNEIEIELTPEGERQAEENTRKQEAFDKILADKIQTHKENNDGNEPDTITYNKYVREARIESEIEAKK